MSFDKCFVLLIIIMKIILCASVFIKYTWYFIYTSSCKYLKMVSVRKHLYQSIESVHSFSLFRLIRDVSALWLTKFVMEKTGYLSRYLQRNCTLPTIPLFILYYTIPWYALYYTILYLTIPYHTILNHTIPYHTIPYHTILYYLILHYTILYYTTLHYTILYYTIPYYTIVYYTLLYYTMLYYTILYCSILLDTMLGCAILILYSYLLAAGETANVWCSSFLRGASYYLSSLIVTHHKIYILRTQLSLLHCNSLLTSPNESVVWIFWVKFTLDVLILDTQLSYFYACFSHIYSWTVFVTKLLWQRQRPKWTSSPKHLPNPRVEYTWRKASLRTLKWCDSHGVAILFMGIIEQT